MQFGVVFIDSWWQNTTFEHLVSGNYREQLGGEYAIAVRDRVAGTTTLATTDVVGNSTLPTGGNINPLYAPFISANGHFVSVYDYSYPKPVDGSASYFVRFLPSAEITSIEPIWWRSERRPS